MTDPKRWKDDPSLPEALRSGLERELASGAPKIDFEAMATAVGSKAAAGTSSAIWLKILGVGAVTSAVVVTSWIGWQAIGSNEPPEVAVLARDAGVEIAADEGLPDAGPMASDAGTIAIEPPPSESSLLTSGRRALGGDPRRALALAERHRALYPRGSLAAEREVLAVQSLLSLGRRGEAGARAQRFLDRHPTSIHRRTMETLRDRAGP